MVDKITMKELKRRFLDPNIPESDIAPYVLVTRSDDGAFRLKTVPNPDFVELDSVDKFEVENAMDWGNGLSRWRRTSEFDLRVNRNDPRPVLLSEGDSWFQFPIVIEDVIDHLNKEYSVYSLDAAGDTADNMIYKDKEYLAALTKLRHFNVAGILLSAAGNDVIGEDETGKPVLLRLVKDYDPNRDAAGHIDQVEFQKTLTFLEGAYREFVKRVRAQPGYASTPIFVHGYDYAIPGAHPGDPRRKEPWAARDEWIAGPLSSKGIRDFALQKNIVRHMIDALYAMLSRVAADPQLGGVHVVDVRGVIGADPKEWVDEIHGNSQSFRRVADKFRAAIRAAGANA